MSSDIPQYYPNKPRPEHFISSAILAGAVGPLNYQQQVRMMTELAIVQEANRDLINENTKLRAKLQGFLDADELDDFRIRGYRS